jgi:hypothetical protein
LILNDQDIVLVDLDDRARRGGWPSLQSSLRDLSMVHANPGLRPGLNSAVPDGTGFAFGYGDPIPTGERPSLQPPPFDKLRAGSSGLILNAEVAQGGAGPVQVGGLLGKAEAEEVFSPAATVECRAGNRADSRGPE